METIYYKDKKNGESLGMVFPVFRLYCQFNCLLDVVVVVE